AAELVAQSQALLQRVAFADDVGADAETLLARTEAHLPAIGRRPDLAEPLGDICLFGLRAHLQQNRSEDAERLGLRCLELVPDLAPNADLHPPRVRRALERARLSRERLGARLVVTAASDQDPGDCAVRVQGRRLGTTPRAEALLAPGRVAVQVECDATPGRVRTVELRRGETTALAVPVSLDRALDDADGGGLALRYASPARRDALRADHGARLSEALGVEALVMAWKGSEAAHLARIDSAGAVVSARFVPGDDEARREALEALRAERSVDLGPARPRIVANRDVVSNRAEAQGGAFSGRRTPTSLGFGYGFVLLGIGATAGGWGTYIRWRETQQDLEAVDDIRFDRRLQQGDAALRDQLEQRRLQRIQSLALGGGGAGLLSLAMPLLLPEREGVPWGAWVAGLAGAGALGAGLYLGRNHETPNAERLRFSQDQPLAGLVALHGAPLLTIPLVYVLRWAVGPRRTTDVNASIDPAPGGARLTLRLAL
ncbi:MAG: hypothetical protein AAF447_27720, partial [Myxococcota bacterium]